MSTTVLKNGLVFTPENVFRRLDIAFSDGVITAAGEVPEDAGCIIDCSGCCVLPGLVDIHFHGCAGADVCDASAEALDRICAYEFSRGTAVLCPATMTLPDEQLERVLGSIAEYAAAPQNDRAVIAGIHLEGPFISREKCGAQNSKYIQAASAGKLRRFQSAAGGMIKLVTIAPEIEGTIQCTEELSDSIHFSLGHTVSGYDTAMRAFAAGADHVTHLYNAMPPFAHRNTGVIGAAIDTEGCYAELICDGVHVSPTAVRAAFRLFGNDRIVLISDSTEAAGMPDGEYTLGGQKIVKQGSRALLPYGTIAGSVSTLYDCLVGAVKMGIPLESAVRAATINPCRSIGIDDRYGSIEAGKAAHFLILDGETLAIKRVI